MSDSPTYWFQGTEPGMIEANENARATFKYFWRECFWERQRIVPALDVAAVKAPFWDSEDMPGEGETVEHMWISDIDFDGENVHGTLMNEPNELKNIDMGDQVGLSLSLIDDWMYVVDGRVFGAYTVNFIRSQMDKTDRREHDEAWGLSFGDPASVEIFYPSTDPADQKHDWKREHLMSKNMAPSLGDFLKENPEMVTTTMEHGFTMLHLHALAGNLSCIAPLLEHGADPKAQDEHGRTPIDLAHSQDWQEVVGLLSR